MCISSPTPETKMQAIFSSTWIGRSRRSWTTCAPMGMTLVLCCRPARAVCRPGSASALLRWNRWWRPPPASTWRACTEAILPSTDWRHLGRLAGFTNQKPARRTPDRYAPWVKLLHARVSLAPRAEGVLQSLRQSTHPHRGARLRVRTRPPQSLAQLAAQRPPPSIRVVCNDGTFANAFRSRTGASWISGSPGICSRRADPLRRFETSSGSPARIFPAATVIPMTTCGAPWRAPLFPPRGARCVPRS